MATDYIVATRSQDKLEEIREILAVTHVRLLSLDDVDIPHSPVEEDIELHSTFVENAIAKAKYFAEGAKRSAEGAKVAVLADDSGLVVKALNGPGVRTKRFALDHGFVGSGKDLDRANNALLLEKLGGKQDRNAHYVCAAALAVDDVVYSSIGTCSGVIAEHEIGDGGFGYDPLFFIEELGVTFAQLSRAQKNERSHRARAFRALVSHIKSR